MKIFKVFSVLCILLLAMNTCNAISYTGLFTGAQSIGYVDEDTFLVAERDTGHVYEFDPTGSGSSSLKFDTMPYCINDMAVDGEGNYYFIYYSGIIEQYDNTVYGIVDHSTHAANFTQIIDMGGNGEEYHMAVNTDGVIFATQGNKVYKLESPTYTKTQIFSMDAGFHAEGITLHPDGLAITYALDSNRERSYIRVIDENGSLVSTVTSSSTIDGRAISAADNKDIYLSSVTHGVYRYNYSDSYSSSVIDNSIMDTYMNSIISDEGVLYASEFSGNMISAVSTYNYTSGYTFGYSEPEEEAEATFQYVNKDINSVYATYYNNSNIQSEYKIVTDYLEYSSTSYDDSDEFTNNYKFRIDLVSSDSIVVDSLTITPAQMSRSTHLLTESFYGIPIITGKAHQYSISGTNTFYNTANWANGTWTLNLYEINAQSPTPSLLDTDTLEVLNSASGTNIIGDNIPDNTNGIVITESLIASPYFYALMIIIGVASAGAVVAQGTGFIGGAAIGTFICGGMSLIPMWLILTLIILMVLLFAIIGGKAVGGD